MRHPRIDRMNGLRTDGQRHLLIEPQIGWLRQADRHLVALEAGRNDAGLSLERKSPRQASQLLHKVREAARAVAAHLARAAVAVIEFPGPIRLRSEERRVGKE